MRCIGCGSTAVSERSERTTQGYRRFRCRACDKQFNERSESLLNRTQYPSDVIALVVLWRLRTDADPDTINTEGPYAYVRHPFYLSYIGFWISTGLIAGMWQ